MAGLEFTLLSYDISRVFAQLKCSHKYERRKEDEDKDCIENMVW